MGDIASRDPSSDEPLIFVRMFRFKRPIPKRSDALQMMYVIIAPEEMFDLLFVDSPIGAPHIRSFIKYDFI